MTSVFKKYYENPEWRRKHLDYMSAKISCPECGFETRRSNMTRHRKSSNHTKRLEYLEKQNISKLIEENEKLKKKLHKKKYKE